MIHERTTPAGPIWEFPPAVARFGQFNVPVSGGGYFRLFPLSWTLRWLTRINRAGHERFVFCVYLSPVLAAAIEGDACKLDQTERP